MRPRGQAEGRQGWISEPMSAPGEVQGRGVNDWDGRDGIGRGLHAGDSPAGPWEAPQPLASTSAGGQDSGGGINREQNGALGTEDSMYPPPWSPPPPPPPPGKPWDGDDVSGGDNGVRGDGGHDTTTDVHAAEEIALPPQEQPSLGKKVSPPHVEGPDGGFRYTPRSVADRGASTSGFGAAAVGGLDPKEVEEFYAKQKMDYDGEGIVDGTGHGELGKGRGGVVVET